MKATLVEIGYYNKHKQCVQEFFNGRNEDKLEELLYEHQVLYNLKKLEVKLIEPQVLYKLKKLEVQSTEHKGATNG